MPAVHLRMTQHAGLYGRGGKAAKRYEAELFVLTGRLALLKRAVQARALHAHGKVTPVVRRQRAAGAARRFPSARAGRGDVRAPPKEQLARMPDVRKTGGRARLHEQQQVAGSLPQAQQQRLPVRCREFAEHVGCGDQVGRGTGLGRAEVGGEPLRARKRLRPPAHEGLAHAPHGGLALQAGDARQARTGPPGVGRAGLPDGPGGRAWAGAHVQQAARRQGRAGEREGQGGGNGGIGRGHARGGVGRGLLPGGQEPRALADARAVTLADRLRIPPERGRVRLREQPLQRGQEQIGHGHRGDLLSRPAADPRRAAGPAVMIPILYHPRFFLTTIDA